MAEQALNAEQTERTRLAESLHDEAIQNLLAVRQDLQEAIGNGDLGALEGAEAAVDATVRQLRSAVFELRPPALEELGLIKALEALAAEQARRAGVLVSVRVELDSDLSPPRQQLIFSLARELVVNVARHSNATSATVGLSSTGSGGTLLEVSDDGSGVAPERLAAAARDGHFGLTSCTERVQAAYGTLTIDSRLGRGTTVRIELPAPAQLERSFAERDHSAGGQPKRPAIGESNPALRVGALQ